MNLNLSKLSKFPFLKQLSLLFVLVFTGFEQGSAQAITVADSIVIEGVFVGNPIYPYVHLQGFGVAQAVQKTVNINKDGHFIIALAANAPQGVYRIIYDPLEYRFFDVILNGEKEIRLRYDWTEGTPTLHFEQSDENKAWLDFQNTLGAQYLKLSVLGNVLANYPDKNAPYIAETKRLYAIEKEMVLKKRLTFVTQNQNSIAGVLAKNTAPKFQNPTDHPRVQAYMAHQSYWEGIDTQNDTLLQTPLYQELIIGYLKYYMSSTIKYSEKELDEGLIASAKHILSLFGDKTQTKTFVIELLTQVFKERGDEKPLKFIDEYRTQTETCAADDALKARMAAYEALKEGMNAPDIALNHPQTKQTFGLKDIKEERILLIFWGSGCEHCQKTMPLINQDQLSQYGVAPIAIGIENNPDAYTKTIEPLKNIFHSSDFLAWDSPAVKDYHIVATPTFILLDKERKIVGKYSNYTTVKSIITNFK